MRNSETWLDRLNDSREHKGDIPNKLYWRIIMGVFLFWAAVLTTLYTLC